MKPDLSPSGRERIEQLEGKVAQLEATASYLQMQIDMEKAQSTTLENKYNALVTRIEMLERHL